MSDWKDWFWKIKWQLISFKFQSFWISILLLVASWWSLAALHDKSIHTAEKLFKLKYIDQNSVTNIITHSQTVLFDVALGHILTFSGVILTSIIAIKGVSYYTNHKTTEAVLKKMNGDTTKEDLKRFLPKKGD